MICGKTLEEIRDAYYKRKLEIMLNEILAKGFNADEITQFEKHIEFLRNEDISVKKRILIQGVKPPTVDELRSTPTTEQQKQIDTWLIEAEKASNKAKRVMETMRIMTLKQSHINATSWLNAGLEVATLLPMIDQDRVYKDQLYRVKLTTIIDTYDVSRAEADERAKITKEYRDYKNATLFRENLEEFIMLCKKYTNNLI